MGEPDIRDTGIRDVEFGENVVVYRPVSLYGCKIGNETTIGPFVEIQRGAVIGARCKIQSHAFVCECVTIGDDCFVSHGAMFINDPFSRGGRLGAIGQCGAQQWLTRASVLARTRQYCQ